jgi:hypothetical protein
MNKIISMNHSNYGDKDMITIPLTTLERLDAERKVAQSLQNQTAWEHIVEKGWEMEGEVFVALVDFANTDPAHMLNSQREVDWGTRFIVSGGGVLELDSHLESAYDERNGDIETDMIF